MNIRPERKEEFPAIKALVKTAFETAQVSNGQEQEFVDHLRAGAGYVPELALAAEGGDGELIGHIMLSEITLRTGTEDRTVLLVAPLSVALASRSQGVGSALMKEGLRRAGEMGYQAVFLVGNPDYYQRFGFKATAEFGIKPSMDIPPQYVLGLELVPGALAGQAGVVQFG